MPALGKLLAPLAEKLSAGAARGVVFIPSGRLGLLPLHAARYEVGGQIKHLLDEFEISYAPSAQSYKEAKSRAETRTVAPFCLVGVGNPLPVPEGVRPLDFAAPELSSIVELLPTGSAKPLYEHDATKPALLAALHGATLAHLSCHGNFALDDPLDSGLLLGDGTLTLREILDRPEPFAAVRLAVLSACQTSVTDFNNLPDEAIGLPAGCLQAGVSAVVGTLWSVYDESTALLMTRFYELILNDRQAPCAALRTAQRWLRELTNADLGEYLVHHQNLMIARQQALPQRLSAQLEQALTDKVLRQTSERPYACLLYTSPSPRD